MRSYLAKTTLSVLLVTLAFAFTSGCGEDDMGFKAGRFGDCGDLGVIANDQWIEDDQEMRLAGNCAWDYVASNRLIGAGIAKNCDNNAAMGRTWTITGRMASKILELPLSKVAFGASRMIRVHVLLERDATETVRVQGTVVGGGNASQTLSGAPTGKELVSLNIDVPEQRSSSFENGLSLSLYLFGAGGGAVGVTIYTIGIFEPQHLPLVPAVFKDTTGASNTIGVDDWPVSTAIRDLLRDQQDVLHWARAAKPNILSQCFSSGYYPILPGSYSTDMDRIGRWIVRKPYGGTSIKMVVRTLNKTAIAEMTASLWSLAKIAYDTESAGFTAGDILEDYTSGARARIVKVQDNGTTGFLWLAYVFGTFSNNDWLRGRDSATGALRGNALQNGAALAGDQVDSDILYASGTEDDYLYFALDTVNEDAEYEIRLDAKLDGGGSATIRTDAVMAYVTDGTAIAHKLPRSSHHEQDDPIRANAYKAIRDTQNSTWHNNRAVILSDSRFENWIVKPTARDSDDTLDNAGDNLANGIAYKGKNSHAITARVTVSKGDLDNRRRIPITYSSGTWVQPEDIIVGAKSGAVAILEYVYGGYVYIRGDVTSFVSGEALSTLGGWNGTANGPPERFSGKQKIRFAVFHTADAPISEMEIDVSLMKRINPVTMEMTINLDTNLFDNDASVVGDYPLVWSLQSWTDVPGDAVTLEQYQVFQAPSTTLDAELYEDQQ